MSFNRHQAAGYHRRTTPLSCHDASGQDVHVHPFEAGQQVVLYHAISGSPVTVHPIDARELLAAGTYVLEPPAE
jgi:hypothetical protein